MYWALAALIVLCTAALIYFAGTLGSVHVRAIEKSRMCRRPAAAADSAVPGQCESGGCGGVLFCVQVPIARVKI